MARKTVISVNGPEPHNLYPAFVIASSSAALGDEVIMWFTPRAGPALLSWELEKVKGVGMDDLIELVKGVQALGGKLYLCSAAMDILGCEPEDLWEGVELKGSTTFVSEAHGATLSLSF